MIESKLEDHYAKVWDYLCKLWRSNPSNTCEFDVSVKKDYFQRFYVCFKEIRDVWNKACIHLIGLDDCFLKVQVKGKPFIVIIRNRESYLSNNMCYSRHGRQIIWTGFETFG